MAALSPFQENQTPSKTLDLSWSLRYFLNYHKEFLIQDTDNDNKIALKALNSILDVKATHESLKIAVDLSNIPATSLLAICYEEGFGIDKNPDQALILHTKAAEANYAPSLNRLGVIYENHSNRNKHNLQDGFLTGAIAQYKAAAALKYVPAIYNLARLYTDPRINFNQEIRKEGFELLNQAARSGYALAQQYLGQHYDTGFLIAKNPDLAVYFTSLAAKQGNPDAEYVMGNFCREGTGVKQDPKKAAEWYRLAADKGSVDAQIRLVNCYTNGDGVEKDLEKANHYQQLVDANPENYHSAGKFYYLKKDANLTPEQVQKLLPFVAQPQPSVFSQLAAAADNDPIESWEDSVQRKGRSPYRDDPTQRRIRKQNLAVVPEPLHFAYKVCKSLLGALGSAASYAVQPCINKCRNGQKKNN